MFTWYLSNQQISYLFPQLIYSWFFSSKSDSDLGTLFPDRTLINWRNVTGDPHSSFRTNGDFLHVIFLSQCYHSCMTVLGFADKSSAPEHYPLPEDMENLRKAQKIEYLYGISEKEVDSFIFQSEEQIQKLKKRQTFCSSKNLMLGEDFPADSLDATSHSSTMAKPEGTMNCSIIHVFSLRIPR